MQPCKQTAYLPTPKFRKLGGGGHAHKCRRPRVYVYHGWLMHCTRYGQLHFIVVNGQVFWQDCQLQPVLARASLLGETSPGVLGLGRDCFMPGCVCLMFAIVALGLPVCMCAVASLVHPRNCNVPLFSTNAKKGAAIWHVGGAGSYSSFKWQLLSIFVSSVKKCLQHMLAAWLCSTNARKVPTIWHSKLPCDPTIPDCMI